VSRSTAVCTDTTGRATSAEQSNSTSKQKPALLQLPRDDNFDCSHLVVAQKDDDLVGRSLEQFSSIHIGDRSGGAGDGPVYFEFGNLDRYVFAFRLTRSRPDSTCTSEYLSKGAKKLDMQRLWDNVFLRALAARDTGDAAWDEWRSFPVFAVDGAIRVTSAWIPIPEGFCHPLGALLKTHDAYFANCLFNYILVNCDDYWAEEHGHPIDEGDYALG